MSSPNYLGPLLTMQKPDNARSTRLRSKGKPAFLYSCLLMSFSLFIWPSTRPLLIHQVRPALTASLSFSTPAAKQLLPLCFTKIGPVPLNVVIYS
jgi:hypothetical protein